MKKFITNPVIAFALLCFLFSPASNSQSVISGHAFSDFNNNNSYDPGEGLPSITVWLMDKNAVSPFYLVYPVQTAITTFDGSYTFTNVSNGSYQLRVKLSTVSNLLTQYPGSTLPRNIVDMNPYVEDNTPNGITDLNILASNNFSDINFGFNPNVPAPSFRPQNRFAFDGGINSFINVSSKTFDLAPVTCNGTTYNPTISFTTDKQCTIASEVYPQAGNTSGANPVTWPGPNKGGFNTGDTTLQLFFGDACYTPGNNDRAVLTVDFSNLVTDVRFNIYDIDCSNPQLVNGSIDHVKVTGYNGSNAVSPVIVLQQDVAYNSISGNGITGWPDYPDNNPFNNYPDTYNSGNADHGNASIYFTDVIDKIVIEYEEYTALLIPSAKKILNPVSPITAESQWDVPATPALRAISIGSIGYSLYCRLLAANLVSFEAKAAGHQVNLQWKADNEPLVKQYTIQRLLADGSWLDLGKIMAGTASIHYFTDKHPATGVNEYRLKILNRDGGNLLSETRKVTIAANINDIEIINNPAPELSLLVNGALSEINIYDASGQKLVSQPVHNTNASGSSRIVMNGLSLNTGVYFVKALFANGEMKTVKFLKK